MNLNKIRHLFLGGLLLMQVSSLYAADARCWNDLIDHHIISVRVTNYTGHSLSTALVVDYFELNELLASDDYVGHEHYNESYESIKEGGEQLYKKKASGNNNALFRDIPPNGGWAIFEVGVPACDRGNTSFGHAAGRANFRIIGLDGVTLYGKIDNNIYGSTSNDVSVNYNNLVLMARPPKPDAGKHYQGCVSTQTQAGPVCMILQSGDGDAGYRSHASFFVYLYDQGKDGNLDQKRTKIN